MKRRAAQPRRVTQSETLDRLLRLKRDFAVVPFGYDNEKNKKRRSAAIRRESAEQERKQLIRDADQSIKGLNFPAEEMAKIMRSWMRQDD